MHNDKKIHGIMQGPFWTEVAILAKDELISYAAQYRVRPDQIEAKNAESISVAGIYIPPNC